MYRSVCSDFLLIFPVCKLEFSVTLSLKFERSVAYQLPIKLESFYFHFWPWMCYNVAGVEPGLQFPLVVNDVL
jgi:hypothetical protein